MADDNRRGGPLLNFAQAAVHLNIAKGTLYSWVSARRVPHVRLSDRIVRFEREALDAWIAASRDGDNG